MKNIVINHNLLNKWNVIVDCPCLSNCRSTIKKDLFNLHLESIKTDLAIRVCYLKGKYRFHDYKALNDIHILKEANSHFDKAFTIAWKSEVKITEPKLWFKRIHTKLTLSRALASKHDANFLLNKAESILDKALAINNFKSNSSLLWLKSEMQSH